MPRIGWLLLVGVSLIGCKREKGPAAFVDAARPLTAEPAPEASEPSEASSRPEPAPPDDVPFHAEAAVDAGTGRAVGEISLGISREALLSQLGPCAERILVLPAAARPTEVFQPRQGDDCLQRFGERRFYVVGGALARIEPGLSHYVPPRAPQTHALH